MKKLLAILFSCYSVFGAIAFDAVSTGPYTAASGAVTFNHTITGANPFLAVCVWSTTGTITSPQYNGVNLTLAGTATQGAANFVNLYYTATAPATGTHAITYTATAGGNMANGTSYTGVQGFDNAVGSLSGVSATPGGALSVVAANSWITACMNNAGGVVFVQGNGTDGSTVNTFRGDGTLGGYTQVFDTAATVSSGSHNFLVFADGGHILTNAYAATLMSIAPFGAAKVRHRVTQSRLSLPSMFSALSGQLLFRAIK